MSNINKQNIRFDDSPNIDAFGRLRSSEPETIFDSKQLTCKQSLLFTESLTGSGASVHQPDLAATELSVTTSPGSVTRRTRQYFNYQPGKSQMLILTTVFGESVAGITKQVGYYDGYNGLFFEDNGGEFGIVIRSSTSGSPIDTKILQADWSEDKLDGYGPSGTVLDLTKAQILAIDFEWLGVGRVRWYFVIGGNFYLIHESLCSNILDTVYMSSANLPLRYFIENVSGAAAGSSLFHICSTVFSEGGFNPKGLSFQASRVSTITAVDTGFTPVVSIRKKAFGGPFRGTMISNMIISLLSTTNDDVIWRLYYNPTIATPPNASWISVHDESGVEYDITRTGVVTEGSGAILQSGFFNQGFSLDVNIDDNVRMGYDIDGVPDEMVLAVRNISATSSIVGGISWLEFG